MNEIEDPPRRPPPGDDELLRLILESATDFAIFTMDPNGIVTSWNTGAERLLGWTSEDIIGNTADVIFPLEEGRGAASAEERRTALALGRAEDERWQERKDGSRIWASGLLMPLADRELGFVKIFRDRTEQHRSEELLRENEERFRVLAVSIPQLVFRTKPTGLRTWGSPQWSVFTGLNLAESLEFRWLDAVHPDDREETLKAWSEAPRKGEYYIEHRIRRKADDEWRWHQTRAAPLEGLKNADEWVGTSADIHDLRSLQGRQAVLLAELQHRTRNLLAVVQSLMRQTLRSSRSLEDFGAEFEGRLRALGRVQGLLARTDHRPIDLAELVTVELSAHRDGDELSDKVLIEGPPVAVRPTAAQAFALAIHELATNAVKYGALSQATGKLSVIWKLEKEGAKRLIRLDWCESGVAMSESGQPRRRGYGSELIERALPYQLMAKTKLTFGPDGVCCEIAVDQAEVEENANG
ncbi:MAG TPA: PAS domain S-box protein [Caulobacteraceae bacterium]